jgi:outer membrane lipoprotein SlyB
VIDMASRAMGWRPARRNVVALFDEMKQAREAIGALEAHGFDAGSISLEGAPATRAANREDTRRRDARVPRFVGSHVAVGAIVGGALGVGIGILIAALAVGGSAVALTSGGVGGAIVGGAIGVMIAGVSSLPVTPDWELTFERDRDGRIMVAVGAEDPAKAQEAAQVLDELQPVSVKQVDASGRPLP